MNTIKHKIGRCRNGVKIHPIADLHIGSPNCNLDAIRSLVEKIRLDYDSYIILNGDLINNAIKQSVSNIYEEQLSVQKSIDTVIEIFEPVKHKILGVVSGNHENRTYKEVGVDVTKVIVDRLGLGSVYNQVSNYIVVAFAEENEYITKGNSFTIYQTHGSGGGKTTGAKASRVSNLARYVNADIYIHSHTHSPIVFKENYLNGDYRGIIESERLFINTNAYEGYGGYGEVMGLIPSNQSPIEVYVEMVDGKKIIQATIK